MNNQVPEAIPGDIVIETGETMLSLGSGDQELNMNQNIPARAKLEAAHKKLQELLQNNYAPVFRIQNPTPELLNQLQKEGFQPQPKDQRGDHVTRGLIGALPFSKGIIVTSKNPRSLNLDPILTSKEGHFIGAVGLQSPIPPQDLIIINAETMETISQSPNQAEVSPTSEKITAETKEKIRRNAAA